MAVKQEKNPFIHLTYLDGLRAMAALYVVLHHTMKQFDIVLQTDTSWVKLFSMFFVYGHYAVDLFIVLSGFCLMLPVIRNQGFLRGNTLNFYKSRAKRILPPYYCAMAVSLILIYTLVGDNTGTLWDWSVPVNSRDIVLHLLLLQDIFVNTAVKINYVFWSISVEWRIYFIFPLLVIFYRKFGAFKTTIFTLIISAIAWVCLTYTNLNSKDYGINPQYFGLFTMGMFSAYVSFSDDSRAKWFKARLGWQTILSIILISISLLFSGKLLKANDFIDDDFAIRDIIFGLGIYCFLSWIAVGRLQLLRRVFSWKPLVFIGTFAYSIYLIHAPLIQVIWQYVLQPMHLSLVWSICIALVVSASTIIYLSYLFFLMAERPFINKKARSAKPAEEIIIPIEA